MFTLAPSKGFLEANDQDRLVSVYISVNEAPVVIREGQEEQAKAFICTLQHGARHFEIDVFFYLTAKNETVRFTHSQGRVDHTFLPELESQALEFVETFGFMMDSMRISGLTSQLRQTRLRALPIFQGGVAKDKAPMLPTEAEAHVFVKTTSRARLEMPSEQALVEKTRESLAKIVLEPLPKDKPKTNESFESAPGPSQHGAGSLFESSEPSAAKEPSIEASLDFELGRMGQDDEPSWAQEPDFEAIGTVVGKEQTKEKYFEAENPAKQEESSPSFAGELFSVEIEEENFERSQDEPSLELSFEDSVGSLFEKSEDSISLNWSDNFDLSEPSLPKDHAAPPSIALAIVEDLPNGQEKVQQTLTFASIRDKDILEFYALF